MIVSVIHQRQTLVFVHSGNAESEFCAAGGVCFYTDTEYLRFYAGLYLVEIEGLGKDLFNGILVSHSGSHTVCGNILEAVAGPDIHNAGDTGFFSKILRNADTSLTVSDPEITNFLVGMAESQTVLLHGMREEGGVKVNTQTSFLCEFNPFSEVLGLKLVTVSKTVFENCVASVYVDFLLTGAKGHHFVHICHELFGSGCLAGIVTCGLDTAGKSAVVIETADIVALPAVYSYGNVVQLFNRSFNVNAESRKTFFCKFKCFCRHSRSSPVFIFYIFYLRVYYLLMSFRNLP